jgi:hypothetical protein
MPTPIIDGYRKIINVLSPPKSPAIAYGEFTTLEEPTVRETESKSPAEAPEINKPITKKIKAYI